MRSFEWSDVERAIARAKLGKAPGLDGMNVEMLRAVWRDSEIDDGCV